MLPGWQPCSPYVIHLRQQCYEPERHSHDAENGLVTSMFNARMTIVDGVASPCKTSPRECRRASIFRPVQAAALENERDWQVLAGAIIGDRCLIADAGHLMASPPAAYSNLVEPLVPANFCRCMLPSSGQLNGRCSSRPAFIPDNGYRQRDERYAGQEAHKAKPAPLHDKRGTLSKKAGRFTPKDFQFNLQQKTCIYPAGKRL